MALQDIYQIPRMNFLKTDRFAFNYGAMALVVGACVAIMGLWYGATMLRTTLLEASLKKQAEVLQQMTEEKDKRLSYAQLAGKKFQAKSAEREFKTIFAHPPQIAEFLLEVAKQLPPQLQLVNVKLEKATEEGEYKLIITGQGKNAHLVSNYTSRLEDSVYFKSVKLVSTEHQSDKTKGAFRFHVEALVLPAL